MRILRLLKGAILWMVILTLAAFLAFVECVADVGGRAAPIRRPSNAPSSAAPPEYASASGGRSPEAAADPAPGLLGRRHQLEDQLSIVVPHERVRGGHVIPRLLGAAPGPDLEAPRLERPSGHVDRFPSLDTEDH